MKYIFIRERFQHMGNHSGYDLLFKHLEKNLDTKSFWLIKKKRNFIIERLLLYIKYHYVKARSPFYSNYSIIPEFKAILYCILHPKEEKIIHIGYLEDNYGLLAKPNLIKRLKNTKIIATTHQPASWWKLHADKEFIKNLDALVVLSKVEKSYFKNVLTSNKISFLPHGVDHKFFHPDLNKKTNTFRCLFSGQWLRDIDLLVDVVESVLSIEPHIYFDIILPRNVRKNKILYKIAKYDQVEWYTNLSDDDLLNIYQRDNLLVMPLLDCTANNAILEAMASGLPIITNNIDAVKSYLPHKDIYIVPNKRSELMVEQVILLYKQNKSFSHEIREHVERNLTWEIITSKTKEIYNSI